MRWRGKSAKDSKAKNYSDVLHYEAHLFLPHIFFGKIVHFSLLVYLFLLIFIPDSPDSIYGWIVGSEARLSQYRSHFPNLIPNSEFIWVGIFFLRTFALSKGKTPADSAL